jgi:hypothetical protein
MWRKKRAHAALSLERSPSQQNATLIDMEIAVRAHAPDDALHSDADALKAERLEVLVQFGLGDSFPVAQMMSGFRFTRMR